METGLVIVRGLLSLIQTIRDIREAAARFPGEVNSLDIHIGILDRRIKQLRDSLEQGSIRDADLASLVDRGLPAVEATLRAAVELMEQARKDRWYYFRTLGIQKSFDDLNKKLLLDTQRLEMLCKDVHEELVKEALVREKNEATILRYLQSSSERRTKLSQYNRRKTRMHFPQMSLLQDLKRIARKAHYHMKRAERRARRFLSRAALDFANVFLSRVQERLTEERISESRGVPPVLASGFVEEPPEAGQHEEEDDEMKYRESHLPLLEEPVLSEEDEEAKERRVDFIEEEAPAVVWIACYEGDQQRVLGALLYQGVDLNAKCSAEYDVRRNPEIEKFVGLTPFLVACMRGHADIVDLLLSTGAVDLEQRTPNGKTGEELAQEERHVAVLNVLQARQHERDVEADV